MAAVEGMLIDEVRCLCCRTQFEQHGTIDIRGLGSLGRVLELFARQFLYAGVRRVSGIKQLSEQGIRVCALLW